MGYLWFLQDNTVLRGPAPLNKGTPTYLLRAAARTNKLQISTCSLPSHGSAIIPGRGNTTPCSCTSCMFRTGVTSTEPALSPMHICTSPHIFPAGPAPSAEFIKLEWEKKKKASLEIMLCYSLFPSAQETWSRESCFSAVLLVPPLSHPFRP